MEREYYYLVASLPELISGDLKKHPFSGFHAFCSEELAPADYDKFRKCFIFNDIRNMCNSSNSEDRYLTPSYYSKEAFLEMQSDTDQFFPFIAEFLADQALDKRLYPELTKEDELLRRFYDGLDDFAGGFVREYLLFELHLRNICTAYSHRVLGLEYKKQILPFDYISEQIAHSSAPDFGLGGEISRFEVLCDMYGKSEALELEKQTDNVRWQWLDDATAMKPFSPDAVCAWAVKLASVERWLGLDEAQGRAMLDSLIAQTKETVVIEDKEKDGGK
ncbi:MAG: DUF2764 family protein [Spirochaetales bacterium]|nr:DUF2764 family protein [Spirochaetales bacterium]